eukprot:341161_1
MRSLILSISLCILQIGTLSVSPPDIKWVTGFTNGDCESHPHAGVQASDGGFFMVGDGECYNSHTDYKRYIWAVKTDSKGKKEWSRAIGDVGYNYGKFGIELNDG